MKKLFSDRSFLVLFAVYAVFAVVNCSTMILSGDDYYWAVKCEFKDIFTFGWDNCRFFSNFITFFTIRNGALRSVIFSVFLIALPCLMAKVISRKGESAALPFFVSALFVLTCPRVIAQNTINWISGFTNYVIPAVLTLLYIQFCLPLLRGEKLEKSGLWAIYTLVIGFLGALCIEHVAFYNDCFAVFIIVLSIVRYKKLHIANVTYFIGSLAGSIMLISNNVIRNVASGEADSSGIRTIEFGVGDIRSQIFEYIINWFATDFFIVHIAIAVCVVTLFIRKFKSFSAENCPKYAKLLMPFIIVFPVYSLLSASQFKFCSLTLSMRTQAVELSLTFMYFVALIYMFLHLLDLNGFIRCTGYLLSTVCLTLPFLFVSPVTPRCFLNEYIFWAVLAGELLMTTFSGSFKGVSSVPKVSAVVIVGYFCAIFSYAAIVDKFVDDLRYSYLREQLDSNTKVAKIITLPYPDYRYDHLLNFYDDEYDFYAGFLCENHGLDEKIRKMHHEYITPGEYYDIYAED